MAGLTEGAGVGAKEYTTSSGTSADVLEVLVSNQGKRLAKRGGRRVRRTEYRKEARIYVPRNTVTGELSHDKVKKDPGKYTYFVRVATTYLAAGR